MLPMPFLIRRGVKWSGENEGNYFYFSILKKQQGKVKGDTQKECDEKSAQTKTFYKDVWTQSSVEGRLMLKNSNRLLTPPPPPFLPSLLGPIAKFLLLNTASQASLHGRRVFNISLSRQFLYGFQTKIALSINIPFI